MRTFPATVVATHQRSSLLVEVTLCVPDDYPTTGVPDEYLTAHVQTGDGSAGRIYSVADHRRVDGQVLLDLGIALHDGGLGADWARRCDPDDVVQVSEPHRGLYSAPEGVPWHLLVCDLTGLPAARRILRGLSAGQRASVEVVVTDADDELPLASAADIDVTWTVVPGEDDIGPALAAAVVERDLPGGGRHVWMAGEARAARTVRRHLRRTLGWQQRDLTTCGYWQADAAARDARYAEVADEIMAESRRERERLGDDEGAYLDALEDIYERAGL